MVRLFGFAVWSGIPAFHRVTGLKTAGNGEPARGVGVLSMMEATNGPKECSRTTGAAGLPEEQETSREL